MNHLIYKALCKQTIVQYKLQDINLDTLITQLTLPITIENDYLFKTILLKQLKDFNLLKITILKKLNLLALFYSYVIKEEYYFQILKKQITCTKIDELIQLTCLFIQNWCNEMNNSKDVKWNSIQFVSYWEFFSHSIQTINSSCIDRNNNSIIQFQLLLLKFIKLIKKDTTHLIQKQQYYNVINHTLLILKDLTILQVSDYDYFIKLIATKDSVNNEIINNRNKNDIKENESRLNINLNEYQLINTTILNIQLKYKEELNEDNINEIFSLITNEKDINLINLIKFKNYLYKNYKILSTNQQDQITSLLNQINNTTKTPNDQIIINLFKCSLLNYQQIVFNCLQSALNQSILYKEYLNLILLLRRGDKNLNDNEELFIGIKRNLLVYDFSNVYLDHYQMWWNVIQFFLKHPNSTCYQWNFINLWLNCMFPIIKQLDEISNNIENTDDDNIQNNRLLTNNPVFQKLIINLIQQYTINLQQLISIHYFTLLKLCILNELNEQFINQLLTHSYQLIMKNENNNIVNNNLFKKLIINLIQLLQDNDVYISWATTFNELI